MQAADPDRAVAVTMFYYGTDFLFPAYTEDAFIIDIDIIVMLQGITITSIAHIWMLFVNLLHFFGDSFIQNVILII